MSTARISIDFPPSVNNLFLNAGKGRGRVPTPEYRAWRERTAWMIAAQKPLPIAGKVNVRVDLVAPDKRRRDADNLAKAPLDAIVRAGLIDDDSAIRRLSIGWEDSGEPCTITITACNPTTTETPA